MVNDSAYLHAQVKAIRGCLKYTLVSQEAEHIDAISDIGGQLLNYRQEFPIADMFYDCFVLLDSPEEEFDTKKMQRAWVVLTKQTKKRYTAEDIMNFQRHIMSELDTTEVTKFICSNTILKITILFGDILYPGANIGGQDTGRTVGRVSVIDGLTSCDLLFKFIEKRNLEYETRTGQGSMVPHGTLKYLATKYRFRNILELFGNWLDNPDEIDKRLEKCISEGSLEVRSKTKQLDKDAMRETIIKRMLQEQDGLGLEAYFNLFADDIYALYNYYSGVAWRNYAIRLKAPLSLDVAVDDESLLDLIVDPNENREMQLLQVAFCEIAIQDILQHRKFYLRDQGIFLRIHNPESCRGLIGVYMREVHNEEHYLWLTGIFRIPAKNPGESARVFHRNFYCPMTNFIRSLTYSAYLEDYWVLMFVLCLLGLFPKLFEEWTKLLPENQQITKEIFALFEKAEADFKKAQISYEYPKHGNVRIANYDIVGTDTHSRSSDESEERAQRGRVYIGLKESYIGCTIRRLPMGQQASFEAQQRAAAHFMKLPPGYTFVSDFYRKQHIVNPDALKPAKRIRQLNYTGVE